MKELSFDHFFTVLGNQQRVRILQLLIKQGPLCVSKITKQLEGEQSAISHSLRQLLGCHFVTVNQSGKERIYTINEETIKPMFKLIEQHVKNYCVKECEHCTH